MSIYAVDTNGPGTVQSAAGQLTMLSERTGGFVVIDNNDIGRGFDRIVSENSTYDLLAYYASHPRDGKRHSMAARHVSFTVTAAEPARQSTSAKTGARRALNDTIAVSTVSAGSRPSFHVAPCHHF